jgi:eukaryotic-like serine/threonine-protein kinase
MTPERIGRYEIERELGQGGMAVVYLGRDPLVKRQVAVKVLPGQFSTTAELRTRFQREAEIIAALEHPAIVPIYDYGEENRQPYIVMRYMPGGSLANRLQRGPLNLDESARVLQRIAAALDRAHAQSIIHRDLKPGNILFDQYGDAYLSDFGIARLAEASVALTGSGVIGTPAYMSPEQVYGDTTVDHRSDIYALGVILFEMLTGQIPYEADTPARMMMKHVLDPVPRILIVKPELPESCEELIERAMAKEVDKRYATAGALVDDLNRLTAIPPAPTAPLSPRTEPPAAPFESEDDTAVMTEAIGRDDTAVMTEAVTPARRPAVAVGPDTEVAPAPARGEEPAGAKSTFPRRWAVIIGLAALLFIAVVAGGLIVANLGDQGEPEMADGPETASEVTTGDDGEPLPALNLVELERFGRGTLIELAMSSDGLTLAAGGSLGIWLYDTTTWEPLELLEGHADTVESIAWSPDGTHLVSGSWDGSIKVWDIATGDYIQTFHDLDDVPLAIIWAPDNQIVAAGTYSGTVYIWDSASGEQLASLYGHESAVRSLAWSPDGTRLASGGEDGHIIIWDTSNGEEIQRLQHGSSANTMVWVADEFLFSGADDGRIRIWDPTNWELITDWPAHDYEIYDLRPSPNGRYLVSSAGDGYIKVWDTAAGLVAKWARYGEASGVAWLADNEQLVAAFSDEVLRLWHFPSETEGASINEHTGPITGLDVAPDETAVALGFDNEGIVVLDSDGQAEIIVDHYTSESDGVAWSPDGQWLAFTYIDSAVVWDLDRGQEVMRLDGEGESYVNDLAWSPEGDRLAVVGWSELLRVWSVEDGELILEIEAPGSRHVSWSPDGHYLATTGGSSRVYIWHAEGGDSAAELAGHGEEVTQTAWSPDGQFLASSSIDGTVRLWAVDSWEEVASLGDTGSAMTAVAWSADSRYLAAGSWSQIWLWLVDGPEEPLTILEGHVGPISGLRWLDDGRLVSAGYDGTLRIWGVPDDE